MPYSFDKEAAALAAIRKRIQDEWRRLEGHERDLIKRGEHEAARALRGRFYCNMDPLYCERDKLIESMPPLTTWNEAGYLERHPRTPEHVHLFDD